jgi:hypothetical protein
VKNQHRGTGAAATPILRHDAGADDHLMCNSKIVPGARRQSLLAPAARD